MKREHFIYLVEKVLDSIPVEFREKIRNLAVLVEDRPQPHRRRLGHTSKIGPTKADRRLLPGVFEGIPTTQRSVFDFRTGPNRIILYQKNIEAVCSNEAEVRHEIRQTVLHELGHYFGMDEHQLQDV
jgi:predicted Zn-dependent protease with MMP-like domain